MAEGAYSLEVLAHFREPSNLGSLPRDDPRVGTGQAGGEGTGRLVRVQLRIDAGAVVTEARFKAFGCPATIACASLVTERAGGASLHALSSVSGSELVEALRLAPERRDAAEVAVAALLAAAHDLQSRAPTQDFELPSDGPHVVSCRSLEVIEGGNVSAPKSKHITWSHSHVTREERSSMLGHGAATLWFTGLSGSGKSTIAIAAERELARRGINAYVLDGDNIRHGLNKNLGFSPEDRTENIRRIGEVAKLFNDAGVVVLTAFISPYREDRDAVRATLPDGEFIEIFVDCPLDECEKRDIKGLYQKARAGEIPEFTGISAPYEAPEKPEITLRSAEQDVEECTKAVITYLEKRGIVG